MKKEIKTEILIHASCQKVWSVLTNFNDYSNWNPFIKSIQGELKIGNKIRARLQPPGAQGMTFTPTILALEPNKVFKWLGHLLVSGLFDGEHCFTLQDMGNGTTLFIQSEKFSGILVSLFKKMIDQNTFQGFDLMNQKLKEICEKEEKIL